MSPRFIIATSTLIIGLLVSWLMFQTQDQPENYKRTKKLVPNPLEYIPSDPISQRQKNGGNSDRNNNFDPNAIPYERVITFSSEEAYRSFLKNSQLAEFSTKDQSIHYALFELALTHYQISMLWS